MRRKKRRSPAEGIVPGMTDADLDRLLHAPTQPFDYPTGKTITEYLSAQGMGPGVDLARPVAPENPRMLSARGGRKYELGRVLSSGSMGVVYEARDLNCRRSVAIKVLPRDVILPKEEQLRFVEEAQITSQLEHPNIVPIHELGLDAEGRIYYVMKYVQGRTLTDILIALRKNDPDTLREFPLSRLLNIFQKACDAIAFAHSRGVVHRDLKPDNIMIGEFGEVVVMDWGLATMMGEDEPAARAEPMPRRVSTDSMDLNKATIPMPGATIEVMRTETAVGDTSRRVLGTPGFMAPEHLVPNTPVNAQSDIYSLGATLYSILCLRAPLGGKDVKEVLRKILAGEIAPPTVFNRSAGDSGGSALPHCPDGLVPAVLSDIAMKGLATHAADRYASVLDMQAEMQAYQDGLVWHVVADQDFSGPDALQSWESIGGQFELRGGELHVSHGEPQVLLYRGDVSGDIRIEFECRQEAVYLNAVGCFLGAVRSENRRDIPLNGYKFEYGAFDNSLNVIERAGRPVASQHASPLEKGKTMHVRAERIGPLLRLSVDGREVLSVVDSDPLSGADRTVVGLFGWAAETIYTRVRISTLGTPWKSDVIDIAERQTQKGNYAVAEQLLQEVLESHPDAARFERARKAQEKARWRERMSKEIATWRERLRQAWPGAEFHLGLNTDGFSLEIPPGKLSDLSAVCGMPVTSLVCSHNGISSLEPLRGAPLVSLNCTGNPISSLEPLRGMHLNILVTEGCPIADLEPLRGMPIHLLNVGAGSVISLEPLRGMPLTFLSCWGNRIESLEPLRGMTALTWLSLNANRIHDLEPVRGLPLVTVNISGNQIESLDPLRGMPLNVLHCGDNLIASVEPLKGSQMKMFSCQANRLKSIDPLKNSALASLVCGGNELASIASFVKNPPDDFRFDCESIPTRELEWAFEAWSRDFRFADHARNVATLLALRKNDLQGLRAMAAEYNGHRCLFIPKFLTWDEAAAFCRRLGGHLVTIATAEKNEFLNRLFAHGAWFWMGLRRGEKGFEWVTGERFEYSNFIDPLQGSKLGPKIFSGRWTSDDVPNAHNSFMVEWDE